MYIMYLYVYKCTDRSWYINRDEYDNDRDREKEEGRKEEKKKGRKKKKLLNTIRPCCLYSVSFD